MVTLEFNKKNPSIFKMVKELDFDGSQDLAFEEFVDVMTARISDDNTKDDLKRIYKLFDTDRTDDISVENLKAVAEELGEEISLEELKEIVQRADLDGDGKFTFEDFFQVIVKKSSY